MTGPGLFRKGWNGAMLWPPVVSLQPAAGNRQLRFLVRVLFDVVT